ncbi:Uma2 family endonuclease [Microbispora amethystogenes]|uniref:Putative restriction endonuclease domain-containing protein n=1 Tax=Microbispora amethystogenes TaxID=1427754 RepID=A0ABQ4FCX1_9ACTN|nr:Uma2 family endonuclease [Microbispora amethystogenes]GIH32677.1 hypothetical protein Mam01_28410 [Microbispora amethystogenes]
MRSTSAHRPPGGWTADDLDHLPSEGLDGEPDLFTHVELIDGALVLAAPQRRLHQRLVQGLTARLDMQAPAALTAVHRMDVKLGDRTRPCPDVMIIDAEAGADMARTFYAAREVHLVVEIVSPESVERDRKLKPERLRRSGHPALLAGGGA